MSSGEEGKKGPDHLPALVRLLDSVGGAASMFLARESLHHPLAVAPDVTDGHAGLLLDGDLDLRDLLRGEWFPGCLHFLRRSPPNDRQSHREADCEENSGDGARGNDPTLRRCCG